MTRHRLGLTVLIGALALGAAPHASAFERDTHYYGTFALALTTCFDFEEAHLIASADWMVDGNRTTVAEHSPVKRHNKIAWHAFGHSSERYHELWRRVVGETDPALRLIKVGQLLHFVQDWEAHARYPVHLGHAKATVLGHDPDSLAKSEARTRHGVQATLDHLAAVCGELGRLPEGFADSDSALPEMLHIVKRDRLVLDLMAASDPGWRTGLSGHLTEHGQEVMTANVDRIEAYIASNLAPIPSKGIPTDFRPGSDSHGIPEPLPIRYDRDGNPIGDIGVHLESAGRQPENDHLDPGDHHVRSVLTEPTDTGWLVRVVVENVGDTAMAAGELTAHVVDGITDEPVGDLARPLPPLGPGESIELELEIATTRIVEAALIGVSVHAEGDLDPYTSDVWVVHPAHRDRLESHVAKVGGLHGPEPVTDGASVELVRPPKIWMTSGGVLCTTVVVRTTGEDPTATVEPARIALLSGPASEIELAGFLQRVWAVTPEASEGAPAVKTFACFDPATELCPAVGSPDQSHRIAFSVRAGLASHTEFVELDESVRGGIARICEAPGDERSTVAARHEVADEPERTVGPVAVVAN
jgi:hypothetical protein